jgi:hypothetical protein
MGAVRSPLSVAHDHAAGGGDHLDRDRCDKPPHRPALGDAFDCRAVELFEMLTLTHFIFGGAPCFDAPSWSVGVEWWCGIALFVLMLPLRAVLKVTFTFRGNLFSQRRLPLQVWPDLRGARVGDAFALVARHPPKNARIGAVGLALAIILSILTGPWSLAHIPAPEGLQITGGRQKRTTHANDIIHQPVAA